MDCKSDLAGDCCSVNPRLADYKSRSWKSSQESRRDFLLKEQKRRREESFNAFRDFSDIFTIDDSSQFDEEWCEWDETDDKPEKPQLPKLKELFMFSEWMTELPHDFQDNWMFVMCPVGKRCLVRSCKGSTAVFGKKGYQIAQFRSMLPSGGHGDNESKKYSKSEFTILDCIWCRDVKKYFVLDVLYWKSQSYLDTDVGFRSFWTKSKIEEMPYIMEKSNKNPYPFIPLEYYPCDNFRISSILSQFPYFSFGKPILDGILFYHKEGFYSPGTTPLVLWLKPYMLVEFLRQEIHIAEEYFQTRPSSYTDMFTYIAEYEKSRKQKKKWKRRKSPNDMEICEVETEQCEMD